MKLLIFDTETTGLPEGRDISVLSTHMWPYIIQLAYILYDTITNTIIEYNDSVKYYPKDEAGRESAINFCKRKKVEFKDKVAGRIFWLTQDFLDANMISSISGKQFRYILPLNKKSRKLLKKSKVDWVVSGPKEEDLIWTKSTKDGKLVLDDMPYINKDETSYNKKNVEGHKKSSDLREFFS